LDTHRSTILLGRYKKIIFVYVKHFLSETCKISNSLPAWNKPLSCATGVFFTTLQTTCNINRECGSDNQRHCNFMPFPCCHFTLLSIRFVDKRVYAGGHSSIHISLRQLMVNLGTVSEEHTKSCRSASLSRCHELNLTRQKPEFHLAPDIFTYCSLWRASKPFVKTQGDRLKVHYKGVWTLKGQVDLRSLNWEQRQEICILLLGSRPALGSSQPPARFLQSILWSKRGINWPFSSPYCRG
jgi:hypothetical protein